MMPLGSGRHREDQRFLYVKNLGYEVTGLEEERIEIQIDGILRGNDVFVTNPEQVKWLTERGFGVGDEQLRLSLPEALFLIEIKRLTLLSGKGIAYTFEDLARKANKLDRNSWYKYLVLRDLRTRGYITREGYGIGIDFNVYEKGEYPQEAPKFLVVGLCEGAPAAFGKMVEILKRAQSNRKTLILAVIDRRNEMVYYSISRSLV